MKGKFYVVIGTTGYTNERFSDIIVKGRENGVATATLIASNKNATFWDDTVDLFDTVQISLQDETDTYHQEFIGEVRNPNWYSTDKRYTGIKCVGKGVALRDTHCKGMYGYTSNQPTIDTIEEIAEDIVDNQVNKSYGSANNTGYAITKTYIPTIDAGLSIPFISQPYQSNLEVIRLLCTLDTAYRNGATAGPHFFVDKSSNLRIKTIGTQQADGGGGGGDWGVYYHGNATTTDETKLYDGVDFRTYDLQKPSDTYANNVVLAFDLRKPAYDWLTEDSGGSALWGNDGLTSITDSAAQFVVGSHSLLLSPAVPAGDAYYPSTEDAGWNIESWGSEKSIPTLNFYYWKSNGISEGATYVKLCTTDHDNDFFWSSFTDVEWIGYATHQKWIHVTLPIGPYWNSYDLTTNYKWSVGDGAPDWSEINSICFRVFDGTGTEQLYIDDLHFSGRCIREAVDTSEVTDHNEHQFPLISRTPLDDSAIASDDTGMAGALTYAELLRRVSTPRTLRCTVPFKPYLKPGEYFTVYLGKTISGSYKENGVDFRVLEYTHRLNVNTGVETDLVLTDDVLNSFPLGSLDARAVLNEYMLENNSKATDMQGGDVDLLIPHLRKTY